MIIFIFTIFILLSIAWLISGAKGRNETVLLTLNLFWWLSSFAAAYFTWLAWQDRGYSENWAMIGFIYISFPYILITGMMVSAELFFIRKWQSSKTKMIKLASIGLLIFLLFQMLIGFLSA